MASSEGLHSPNTSLTSCNSDVDMVSKNAGANTFSSVMGTSAIDNCAWSPLSDYDGSVYVLGIDQQEFFQLLGCPKNALAFANAVATPLPDPSGETGNQRYFSFEPIYFLVMDKNLWCAASHYTQLPHALQ